MQPALTPTPMQFDWPAPVMTVAEVAAVIRTLGARSEGGSPLSEVATGLSEASARSCSSGERCPFAWNAVVGRRCAARLLLAHRSSGRHDGGGPFLLVQGARWRRSHSPDAG